MRVPAVAGQFYEDDRDALLRQIEGCYTHRLGPGAVPKVREGPRKLRGLVVPHAGLMYSGPVAAHAYKALAEDGLPETFVILGPNHTGLGAGVAVGTVDWETPIGPVRCERDLAKAIAAKRPATEDLVAHRFEHSIEVQLPFLVHLGSRAPFVPVCIGTQDYDQAVPVGEAVRDAIRGRDAVVIASTDFSHYIPKDDAYRIDKLAYDRILALDVRGFWDTVRTNDISMCGYGPVIAMMTAVHEGRPELLKYATSGDVSPMRDVVGYAAIAVYA
ncbi:MAG TPA: AmmeMemoRadiSam system protein B [Thermoplasmata archaeon]|nr:AmmeMemoRadiSam system protein B [Thermoplasmata archaeon]